MSPVNWIDFAPLVGALVATFTYYAGKEVGRFTERKYWKSRTFPRQPQAAKCHACGSEWYTTIEPRSCPSCGGGMGARKALENRSYEIN